MKKLAIISAILFALSIQSPARDIYDITFDSLYKANKIYYSLDKELGRVYRRLKRYLSPQGRRILNRSEKEWIVRRDHRCAFPETHSVNIDCAIRETRERLYFLRERLRECQEIGCRIDRLY